MKFKTYTQILITFLIFFISKNVMGQAPTIIYQSPSDESIGISINPTINMVFSTNILGGTGTNITLHKESDDSVVESYFIHQLFQGDGASIDNNVLSITPTIELDGLTTYYILIDNLTIQNSDLSGNFFIGIPATEYKFTTIETIPAPTVTNYSPNNGASNVSINQDLILTFNENIDLGTNGERMYINDDTGGGLIISTSYPSQSITNNVLTISNLNLSEGKTYSIEIENGYVANENGIPFEGISDNSTWSFSTTARIPTVSFSPSDQSDGISIHSQIIISYSEAMIKTDDTELTNDDLVPNFITLQNEATDIPYNAVINDDKTTITITPTSTLPEFKRITTTVGSLKGIDGNGETGIITSNFTTDGLITWNGSISTDISNNANWDGSFQEGISVHIPITSHNPIVLTGEYYVRNLIIDAGATLTIADPAGITVGKDVELRSSNDPNIGNANLIIDGEFNTDGATVNVHQMVERDHVALYVSSPVQSSTPAGSPNVRSAYEYDSPIASWTSLGQDDTFDPGIGYFAYADEGNITFNGPVNQNDIPAIETYRTTSPNNYGWNLLGNPYPCSIDWNLVDKTNMKDQFYIMKRDNQSYGVYNSSGGSQVNLDPNNPSHIPSCHAFWVQVPLYETKGSVSFTTSSRVDTHYSYLKTTSTNSQQEIRFSGVNSDDIEDELLIAINDLSDDSFDDFDSERRMSSNNELLQLYTIHSNKKMVIDTYNNLDANKSITLGYQVGQEGTYRIKLKKLVNIDDNINIYLEDTELGTSTRLEKDTEYTFQTESGANNDRFIINLQSTSTDLPIKKNEQNILVYSVDDNIFIKTPELLKPTYKIYDISGALIDAGNLSTNSTNIIKSKALGIIIVKVISVDQNYNQKIIVKK